MIDIHANEAIVTLAFVVALNMILGAAAPRKGWYWPFLSVIGIPLINFFPGLAGAPANPNLPRTFLSYGALVLLMLAGALGAMLFGVIVRRSAAISRRYPSAGPYV